MSAYLTAMAGAITAIGVGAVAVGRNWPGTSGRHRAPRVRAVLDEASLDELLGPWPEPAYGAAVAQAWADCPHCAKTTAGVVHRDGTWTCGECIGRPRGEAA